MNAPATRSSSSPTYNERENLPVLVDALLRHAHVRVLVVDDQSPDGTGEVADALARAHPGRIDVMHRTGPRGLGRSYIDGIALGAAASRWMSSARWTRTSRTTRGSCRR